MKKILFLFTDSAMRWERANPVSLTGLLNNSLNNQNIEYSYGYYEDLLHIVDGENSSIVDLRTKKKLEEYDLVYHRLWGGAPEIAVSCSIYLKNKGVAFIDEEAYRPGSMDKLSQCWRIWESALPVPKTVFVPKKHVLSWAKEELKKHLNFPLIMKSTKGTRGKDNYLVRSFSEIIDIVDGAVDMTYLFQEYIPNDCDYRAIILGDSLQMLIKRSAANGSHLNNTSMGGSAEIVPLETLPAKVRSQSEAVARNFTRDIAGVDIIFNKNQPEKFYFLEVNRSPQIEASSFSKEKADAINAFFNQKLKIAGVR